MKTNELTTARMITGTNVTKKDVPFYYDPAKIIKESEKAIQYHFIKREGHNDSTKGINVWIPKSIIKITSEENLFTIPLWFYTNKINELGCLEIY